MTSSTIFFMVMTMLCTSKLFSTAESLRGNPVGNQIWSDENQQKLLENLQHVSEYHMLQINIYYPSVFPPLHFRAYYRLFRNCGGSAEEKHTVVQLNVKLEVNASQQVNGIYVHHLIFNLGCLNCHVELSLI